MARSATGAVRLTGSPAGGALGDIGTSKGAGTLAILMVGAILIGTLHIPRSAGLAGAVAIVDGLVLLGLATITITALRSGFGDFSEFLRRFVPWAYVWLVLNLTMALITGDSGLETIKVAAALLYLFVTVGLLLTPAPPTSRRRLEWVITTALAVFGVRAIVTLVTQGFGVRETLGFNDPNHTGSFAVTGLIVLLFGIRTIPKSVRSVVIAALALSLVASASYTAVGAGLVAVAYASFSRRLRGGKFVGAALVAAAIPVAFFARPSESSRFSERSLERSSQDRFDIWGEGLDTWLTYPLGAGYERAVASSGLELHNDYLSSLVALGPLGLILLFWLGYLLWTMGGPATRAVIVASAVTAMTHAMLSWRHVWVFMGIAIVLDIMDERNPTPTRSADLGASPGVHGHDPIHPRLRSHGTT